MGRPKKNTPTAADVDMLGSLLAQISDLSKQADAIKTKLKESGMDCKEGALFNAVVVHQMRTTLDSKKVRLMLGDKVALCERTSETVSVRVNARKAS